MILDFLICNKNKKELLRFFFYFLNRVKCLGMPSIYSLLKSKDLNINKSGRVMESITWGLWSPTIITLSPIYQILCVEMNSIFMPQIFSFSRILKHFSYSKNLSCSEKINKYSLAFSFLGFPFSQLFSFFNLISSTFLILPVLFSLQFYFFFAFSLMLKACNLTPTHTHTHTDDKNVILLLKI